MAQKVKNLPAMQEAWVRSLCWEDSLEKGMQPTPVFLLGKFHGQRNLVGYSCRGHKESDTTKRVRVTNILATHKVAETGSAWSVWEAGEITSYLGLELKVNTLDSPAVSRCLEYRFSAL